MKSFQSEEGFGKLEADSNVNFIFREKLNRSTRSYPSSPSITSTTTSRNSGTPSKSGFRKIRSNRSHSSVTGSLPSNLDKKPNIRRQNSDDDLEKEPEMLSRIDVEATGTDIASKLMHLMSGNNAFNANVLVKNVKQEIVHRADPNLTSPSSPSISSEPGDSGKRKYRAPLKSPDISHSRNQFI